MDGPSPLTTWWWNDRSARPAWQQMALDRTLADVAAADGRTIFRLYRWNQPTLSLGANESALPAWDRDRLDDERIESVRRPTGGRGVWHHPADLTYAVAGPLKGWGDLRSAYRSIHWALAEALGSVLSQPVALAPATRRPTLAPGACFDLAVGGEVLVAGRKTIGSAQAVIGPALLQHGAIALADRAPALSRFRVGAVTAENGSTPCPFDQATVGEAIIARWCDSGARPLPAHDVGDLVTASLRWQTHFQDPAWTWRR